MRALIFAKWGPSQIPEQSSKCCAGDLLLAANGGARHCLALDLPRGDHRRLQRPHPAGAQNPAGCRRPARAAPHSQRPDRSGAGARLAPEAGAEEVIVFGAVGGRWDQSLGNFILATADKLAGMAVQLLDGPQRAQVLRAGETLRLKGAPGDTVSLIPLCDTARGIRTTGLEYPLDDDTLPFGTTRGISNTLTGTEAHVHLTAGLLVCVVIRGPLARLDQTGG